MTKIGIIGGSGLDDPKLLQCAEELRVTTPFGDPSSPITVGTIERREVAIIARHGRQHTIPPTQVNYRANIHAIRSLNCGHILATAKEIGLSFHERGTVVTIEGPRFSTRAESRMFRIWGGDVVNMSIAPEAILANEAGIPYAAVAMSTDYDCWKIDEMPVEWSDILKVFQTNVENVKKLLLKTTQTI